MTQSSLIDSRISLSHKNLPGSHGSICNSVVQTER